MHCKLIDTVSGKPSQTNCTQECIPVGCVPAARRPYAGVSFPGGGWCGWSSGRVGGVAGPGGCLVWGGVAGPGGVVWLVPGGGGVVVSQHALRQTPSPYEQNE